MDDEELRLEIIQDLRRDAERHDARAAQLEEDARERRKSAARCRQGIEYLQKHGKYGPLGGA